MRNVTIRPEFCRTVLNFEVKSCTILMSCIVLHFKLSPVNFKIICIFPRNVQNSNVATEFSFVNKIVKL